MDGMGNGFMVEQDGEGRRQCGDELQGGWVGVQEVQGGRGAISEMVCV